jgi:hypothetical protein
MKTFIELELHYWDHKYLHRMYGYEWRPGTGKVFKQISSSWVAEITDIISRYGFARRFLDSKRDYSRADNKGFKGIYAEFILESGRVYEVKNYKDRYFCRVDDECNIIKISEAEVIECLRNRSASMS